MKTKTLVITAAALLSTTLLFPLLCFAARDLSSAAETAVSQVTGLAKVLSVLGVVAGALIYQIPGATMFARGTIVGGLIGAGLSFGGPSVIGAFRTIFGG